MSNEDLIKDSDLIVSCNVDDASNTCTYIIKNKRIDDNTKGVYFNDVFNFLPHGLIVKNDTGMGATTLELVSNRNSIIVEPLRVTASRKAIKHKALYVGSPFDRDDIKTYKQTEDDIRKSLRKQKGFKKIITVADSLPKVIKALSNHLTDENYYLLIDEIDSFQIDSSFRGKMEECIEIYKQHPKTLRGMLTATPIKFSDASLNNEPTTIVSYEVKSSYNVDLLFAKDRNVQGVFSIIIKTFLSKYKDRNFKLMVAYNSVEGCYRLAGLCKSLNENLNIKILCGVKNQAKIELKPYLDYIEDDKLPADINFVTSAYFTGFDIDEDYHLIVISDIDSFESTLSFGRILQISGRCRKKLITHTIIYSAHEKLKSKNKPLFTEQQLINAANNEIKSIECINHNFKNDTVFKNNILNIRQGIVSATSLNGYKFVRLLGNGEPQISFLNIDAFLENQNAYYKLYNGQDTLKLKLTKSHFQIKNYIELNGGKVDNKEESLNQKYRKRSINEALEYILNSSPEFVKDLSSNSPDDIVKRILKSFDKFSFYINNKDLVKQFEQSLKGRSDLRVFNDLVRKLNFQIMNPKDHYKQIINSLFKEGANYRIEELIDLWNSVFTKSGMQHHLTVDDKVVSFTNLHFQTKRSRKSLNGEEVNSYIILSFNPTSAQVIKFPPIEDDFDHDRWFRDMGF